MTKIKGLLTLKSTTEEGWFCGYASVYDTVDLHKDRVEKGAFQEALESGKAAPKMLWQHDAAQPIGRWNVVEERTDGLYVEGQLFLELAQAKEAFILMKEGVVDALSIGFQIVKSRRGKEGRILEKVQLHEISLVTFPANLEARILQVKDKERIDEEVRLLSLRNQEICEDLLERIEKIKDQMSHFC
jgi:HK97 family phage prohead protease